MAKKNETNRVVESNSVNQTTSDYGIKLYQLLVKSVRKYPFLESRPSQQHHQPRTKSRKKKIFNSLLQLLPTTYILLFLISFYWDFNNITYKIGSVFLSFEGIIRIVSISGLIGFGTNWLAITMLFKPGKKRPIFGQGLIPSQKEVIAFRLAQAISTDLINPGIIQKKITDSQIIPKYRDKSIRLIKSIVDDNDFRTEFKLILTEYLNEIVANPDIRSSLARTILHSLEESIKTNKLEQIALQTYLFIRGKEAQSIVEQAISKLPDKLDHLFLKIDETIDTIPSRLEKHSEEIEGLVTEVVYQLIHQVDIHHLIEENIQSFEEQRLEKMIKGATNEQLRYIQYLGALLGAIGGLVIWSPIVSLILLGGLLLFIWSLDQILYTFTQKSA